MQQYDWLLSKLDAFIRKYYINQLLRGGLILLCCVLFYVLTASVSEYFLYLPVWMKVFIVAAFSILGLIALIFWIIIPLSKMARLGRTLSHEQAARIIGAHFPEISDKLLNILQLKRNTDHNESKDLIEASINQKAGQIAVVPISRAVDLSKNKKYLPFLLPLILIGIFILVAAPNVFRDASNRLLQPTKSFEKPAPFQFIIQSQPLLAVRNGDFTLKATVKGNALPAALSIELGNDLLPMTSLDNHNFQYTFKNVTEPVNFRLFGAGFYSQPFTLKVAQKPVLKAIKVQIDYPGYTGKKDEIRTSLGDMTLPVGTRVGWAFATEYTDAATLNWANGGSIQLPKQCNVFLYQHQFLADTAYTISLNNKSTGMSDSFHYQVQVIPDQYPVLQVQEFRDTVSGNQIVLTGTAGDDYGISRILFHYTISDGKGRNAVHNSIPLKNSGGSLATFQQYFDVEALNLQQGQKVTYFVEAWDNDGVHGPKASRSEVMTYQMFSPQQLDSAMSVNSKQISSGLSNSAQQTQQMQQEIKDVQTKMLQSNEMDFESQQQLKELSEKQLAMQKQMEATKKRFEDQIKNSEQKQYSEELKDKQDDLKKQMDNLLNNELKEQMKKLQDLMAKLNKQDAQQTMEQMEDQNKLFDMDLKRMQETMKQLEMQMRMEDLANKMEQLAKAQTDLKKETDEKKKDNQALTKAQDDLKKELQKAMNGDMKEMQKLNSESQQKQDMQTSEKQAQQANQNMQQSEQQLQQNENSKSGESQSKAAENLQEMADQLRQQAGGMSPEQIEMNIRAVRQLLSNLMRLSFDQEDLMAKVKTTAYSSQSYLTNQSEQNRLYGNSHLIRDSLFSLSKNLSKLSVTVNKETTELERNMKNATAALEDRQVGDALTRQQYVMTHANNLALMLNEILSNLIQQQNQGSSGSCSKPGGMKPKSGKGKGKGKGAGDQLSDIITQQQQLGNAMQQMQASQQAKSGGKKEGGQKPGEQPGGKQPGDKPGKDGKGGKEGQNGSGQGGSGEGSEGEYGDAQQLAQLANQQAQIRQKMQQLQNILNSKGIGANGREMREIQDKMDKNESDLVNRQLNNEFFARQREIQTRLLEAEKSLREQEQDDKRSSNSAKEITRTMPPELLQYLQNRQNLLDLYRTVPPQLKPYYKSMVDQYFKTIGSK